MFNSVEFVREKCKEKGIPISQIEKDCGFSNGYLNPKKMSKIPSDRALIISQFLNIPVQQIMFGEYTESPEPEHDILDDVDVAFYGDYRQLTEDDKEMLRAMAKTMLDRRKKRE